MSDCTILTKCAAARLDLYVISFTARWNDSADYTTDCRPA